MKDRFTHHQTVHLGQYLFGMHRLPDKVGLNSEEILAFSLVFYYLKLV